MVQNKGIKQKISKIRFFYFFCMICELISIGADQNIGIKQKVTKMYDFFNSFTSFFDCFQVWNQ